MRGKALRTREHLRFPREAMMGVMVFGEVDIREGSSKRRTLLSAPAWL